MKTLKKIFPFFALLGFFVGVFSACQDDDCGCDPVISHILPSSAASKDSIIVGANSEEFIIIVGENLAAVTSVVFDGVPAVLNPAFITDNYIILQIPEINSSTQRIRLTTAYGKWTETAFAINIPAPVVLRFYCEFVPEGEILRVRGRYFFNPKVFFYNENDDLIPASKVEVKGSTELFVTVPAGVTHSKPIVVETGSGKTASRVLFRDRRNMIIDFDEYQATVTGTMVQQPWDDAIDRKPTWKESLIDLLPAGFELPAGCDGLYDQINLIEFNEGGYVAYQADKGGRVPPLLRPLIGDFGSYDLRDLVVKFEVYVPSKYPINGIYANLCFPPRGNNGSNSGGRDLSNRAQGERNVPGGWWCPFEAGINKAEPFDWQWEIGAKAKESFYTDWSDLSYSGKWMTVSVPLFLFIWDLQSKGINTDMHRNFGDYPGSECLAINTLSKDWNVAMGDFTFMWEPWAVSGQEGVFLCFVDNFRVVPDDGSGVQYGKVGQREARGTDVERGRPY